MSATASDGTALPVTKPLAVIAARCRLPAAIDFQGAERGGNCAKFDAF
jgi:hypothetical protein